MSMTVVCALVLVGIIATCFCEPIEFKTCDKTPSSIEKVEITPCPSQPCTFKHGENVTVNVYFTSVKAAANLTAEIYGVIAGVPVKFNMPDSNGCSGGIKCPIQAEQKYVYSGFFNVLKTYPIIRLVVKWDLISDNDEDSYQFCFLFPMSITA